MSHKSTVWTDVEKAIKMEGIDAVFPPDAMDILTLEYHILVHLFPDTVGYGEWVFDFDEDETADESVLESASDSQQEHDDDLDELCTDFELDTAVFLEVIALEGLLLLSKLDASEVFTMDYSTAVESGVSAPPGPQNGNLNDLVVTAASLTIVEIPIQGSLLSPLQPDDHSMNNNLVADDSSSTL